MLLEERKRSLVDYLKRIGFLKDPEVERAFLAVPRELFVPPSLRELAYEDRPLPIGFGQTISAPGVVVRMTELLKPRRGDRVLEVGTGSGYQAAILAEIVKPEGHVWTIERIPSLAERARENLRNAGYAEHVTVVVGDGSKGYPEAAPFDRIIVTAACPSVPEPLVQQLKPGGRLVLPVGGPDLQVLVVVEKREDGGLVYDYDIEVVFVPLIGEFGWKDEESFYRYRYPYI